jgi:FdhD protein
MAEIDQIYQDREVLIYKGGGKTTARHPIVKETPLTIVLNGEAWATLMCSPHFFELLAIGFLVSEGILQNHGDLKDVSCRPEQGIVWVHTADGKTPMDKAPRRILASRRGKGGYSPHFFEDPEPIQPIAHMTRFAAQDLLDLVVLLDKEAKTFRLTGGVHEAAMACGTGFVVSYEDIGRLNALDRILGYTFLNAVDPSDKAVLLSSRVSAEMLAKVARIGVPVVVSRAAPTCLSIDLAEQLGITLVGFARGSSLNVYTHPGRIVE